MAEIDITESEFTLPDGVQVYQKTWTPSSAPVAKLLHFHGFSDHISNCFDFFPTLARRGILCSGVDGRGWGRSVQTKKDRGNTGPRATILADMAAFIETQLASSPSVPVFVMGHSMGGALVATLASTPKYQDLVSQLGGIMLSAPCIGLDPVTQPNPIVVIAGRLLGRFWPHYQLVQELKAETIARDPVVQQALRDDPLNHVTGTLEMFANMLDLAEELSSGKLKLNDGIKSIHVAHGTGDQVTSYDISKQWYDAQTSKVADREFKSYDGWSHLLHADLPETRQVFADDIADWILHRAQA